jgi:hypothetical protein
VVRVSSETFSTALRFETVTNFGRKSQNISAIAETFSPGLPCCKRYVWVMELYNPTIKCNLDDEIASWIRNQSRNRILLWLEFLYCSQFVNMLHIIAVVIIIIILLKMLSLLLLSPDSDRLDGRCSIPGDVMRVFSTHKYPDRLWGTPNLQFNGHHAAHSPGTKRPGREAYYSHQSSVKIKNGGANPPLPTRLNSVVLN